MKINLYETVSWAQNPLPLPVARAAEKLRYIAWAVDACGGSGKLAAQSLGIKSAHFSQYTTWAVRRCRTAEVVPPHPRFAHRTKLRPVHELRHARLRTLREHILAWERRYIETAVERCGSVAKAAEAMSIKRHTIYMLRYRRGDLGAKRDQRQEIVSAEWWMAVLALCKILMACALVGISLPLSPAPIVATRQEVEFAT